MRMKEAKNQLIREFRDKKLQKPEFLARVLLEEVLFLSKIDQITSDQEITNKQMNVLITAKKRMLAGEPLSYIVGRSAFRGLKLHVSKDVLIPRPETEELVDIIKPFVSDSCICIDIGTGSGAIAISLAKETTCKHVYACDVSKKALKIALANIELTETKNKIQLFQIDAQTKSFTHVLKEICKEHHHKQLIIVANLPYIPTLDILKLKENVRSFEPHLALDGGKYGTEIIKEVLLKIEEGIGKIPAHVFFEIDSTNITDLKKFISEKKYNLTFKKDLSSKTRFLIGTFNE